MTPRWDASRLTFDAEKHEYHYDGLQRLLSVSEVMELSGVSDVYTGDQYYSTRGSMVHAATELIDAEDLDWNSLDYELSGYCAAYLQFTRAAGFKMLHSEMPVAWPELGYAGTLDRLAERDGRKALLDLKTGSKPLRSWPIQLSLYAMCFEMDGDTLGTDGEPPLDRYVVRLSKDGTWKPKRDLLKYESPRDEVIALAALELARWHKGG